jgi:hypothetical protein
MMVAGFYINALFLTEDSVLRLAEGSGNYLLLIIVIVLICVGIKYIREE